MSVSKSATITLPGKHRKPVTLDYHYNTNSTGKVPTILFVHGFKGFKDWGYFDLMAQHYANNGFLFVKMNFSHNGTTLKKPTDFADLEAFGNNNFSKELDDMATVIDFLHSSNFDLYGQIDFDRLFLKGHSRGGGVALIKASEDERIKAIATLAAVADIRKVYSEDTVEKWKSDGVLYIENSRTRQQMPLYYQLVEDTLANKDRLNIPRAVKDLKKPLMITHGTADETLPYTMAKAMHSWKGDAKLVLVEGADHTFGGKHPYTEASLPKDAQTTFDQIIAFFKSL